MKIIFTISSKATVDSTLVASGTATGASREKKRK